MGGYMGLGLQQWIYSRDPQKKMFQKNGLKSFTALPKYSRTFTLQPSRKENKKLNGFLTVSSVICFLILSYFTYHTFLNYSTNHVQDLREIRAFKKQEAFNFLVNSGESRLRKNEISGAYAEFKLAHKINPKDEELNQLIIQTLSILCSENNSYCNALDTMLTTP